MSTIKLSNNRLLVGYSSASTGYSTSYQCEISGNAYISANTYVMGNLGINTTTPAYALDVNGVCNVSSISIGNYIGNPYISTASSYTGLGIYYNTRKSNKGYTEFVSYSNTLVGGFLFCTNGSGKTTTDQLLIDANGNMGIGTLTTTYPLNVTGGTSGISMTSGKAMNSTNNTIFTPNATNTISMRLNNGWAWATTGFIATSDRRIKTNIVDIDDANALDTLRLIQPKRYNYIDVVEHGSEPVWGFIAQQIQEVLPYATSFQTEYIPNIYEMGTVGLDGITVTLTNKSTMDISLNAPSKTRIKFINVKNNKMIESELDQIIDAKNFTITPAFESKDLSNNQIFVFGQEVFDFCILDKNAIFTITTAAAQQVDRNVQSRETSITNLESQIQDIQTKVDAVFARLSAAGISYTLPQ